MLRPLGFRVGGPQGVRSRIADRAPENAIALRGPIGLMQTAFEATLSSESEQLPMSSFQASPAGPTGSVEQLGEGQIGQVVALLRSASERAVGLGSMGWSPRQVGRQAMAACARREELFGWVDGDQVLGCVVIQARDVIHWPDDAVGEALYLHKLAVRPAACGRGIGTALIAFTCALAAERGRPMVRLDTVPGTPLVAYYERHGFRLDPGGPADYAGRWLVRMERPVASTTL